MKYFCANQPSFFRKAMSLTVLTAFLLQSVFYPASSVHAQLVANLPAPGATVPLTNHFEPPILLGMTINAQNPLLFEFLIDRGQDQLGKAELTNTSDKLVKYFLSAMTVPDADSWVNLSPYEKDLIMPDHLSATEMGKTMLEQDYILKQLSASLTNPEKELGKRFWDTVKKKAFERFGTTELPMSTINKVWIVPQKALVLEKDGFVLIGESRLKVMLEEDYVALANQKDSAESFAPAKDKAIDINKLSSEIFREMILPELEKEINEGSTFAPVRQIYHAVILATWYKKNLRESLLGKVYIDKNKIAGVDIAEKDLKEKVYQQYLSAFEKGVYNFIKDEVDLASKETLPRKYFSGGTSFIAASSSVVSEDLSRPSANAKRDLVRIEETMGKGRVSSVNVQLADSKSLGNMLRDKAAASSAVEDSLKYYFGEKSNVGRGIHVLEDSYKLSTFLGPRNEKGPATILLVGAGWGVTALQMALRYPNFTIWAVNKEKGLWNIAQAISRVGQFEKDRYSDRQIVEALNRIKVVESLDIEDDRARQEMLRSAPAAFDAVIIETNVSMYFADQVRAFEKLFNERVKADGFFAFEFFSPRGSHLDAGFAAAELTRQTVEQAFAPLGKIQLQDSNVTYAFTVERNNPGPVNIPLDKDWGDSMMAGGQSSDQPRVFMSQYIVRSSSAVGESSNMIPVEVNINRTKKSINVSRVIVRDGVPSPQLIDQISRLIANLKGIKGIVEVDNIIDDPNAEVVFYNSANRTVIVPRYVSLSGINDRLEDRRIDVMMSSSGVVATTQINPIPVTGSKKGGIDFNPALFDLQIKRDGKGVPLPLPQQNLENIHVEGFYPVIINIQPANLQNFPLLLSAKN